MSTLYHFDKDETSSPVVKGSEDGHSNMTTTAAQQIIVGGGDQEMITLLKSLEADHREMSGAMQKLEARVLSLETENAEMSAALQTLEAKVLQGNTLGAELAEAVRKLTVRVEEVERTIAGARAESAREEEDLQQEDVQQEELQQEDGLRRVEKGGDDIDLFGDDDGAETPAPTAAEQKKPAVAKKPAVVAKSTILLDVKPWDDETDMAEVERKVRSVQADGLLWGASKLVEVGYGIKKLQINCVVEDDKVGTDLLEDEITKFEDFVQSVDIASFNKI